MITCERCSTENIEGTRYCDACGAALWLAGRPSERPSSFQRNHGSGSRGNGADGRGSREASITAVHSSGNLGPSVMSEQQTSASLGTGTPHAMLVIERGNSAGKQFPLSEKDANIGRWDADGGVFPDVDLDADDPEAKVSRRHARISLRNGQYLIEDLGSTNGTFVNRGHRLVPGHRHPLRDGDEIIVGKTFLRFRITR